MTSKNSNDIDQNFSNNNYNNDYIDDQQHPTHNPFTSPENPDNPNKAFRFLPLAALGGLFNELCKKIFNFCDKSNREWKKVTTQITENLEDLSHHTRT